MFYLFNKWEEKRLVKALLMNSVQQTSMIHV